SEDPGSQDTAMFQVPTGNDISGNPAHFISRRAQWTVNRFAGNDSEAFRHIADRIHVRHIGLHLFVYGNSARRANLHANLFSQLSIGTNPNREEDDISFKSLALGGGHTLN